MDLAGREPGTCSPLTRLQDVVDIYLRTICTSFWVCSVHRAWEKWEVNLAFLCQAHTWVSIQGMWAAWGQHAGACGLVASRAQFVEQSDWVCLVLFLTVDPNFPRVIKRDFWISSISDTVNPNDDANFIVICTLLLLLYCRVHTCQSAMSHYDTNLRHKQIETLG